MNDRLGLIGAGSVDKGVFNVDLVLHSLLRFGIRVLEGCTGFFLWHRKPRFDNFIIRIMKLDIR